MGAVIAYAAGFNNMNGLAGAPVWIRYGLNLGMNVLTTALPLLLGFDGYMNFFTIIAGTAANWLNLFLPSCVVLFMRLLPAYRMGAPWARSAVVVVWILLFATASAASSAQKIFEIFHSNSDA